MPQLGESVTEGTVTRWLKQVGDTVTADEPLLEVSTDKVDTEIPSPVSGVLLEIVAGEDAVVPVGGALAIIGDTSDAPSAPVEQPVAVVDVAPVPPAPVVEIATPVADVAPAVPVGSGSNVPVLLPALGESVTEGTVTRWLKQVGDKVAVDEALLEVSTDKVDTEIPSPVEGVLLEITVGEDGVAQVGGQLGVIGTLAPASQDSAPTAPAAPTPTPTPAPTAPTPPAPASVATPNVPSAIELATANSGAYATPLVRRLAAERGVDLSTVVGTGVGGRIRKEDVLNTAPTQVPVAQPVDRPVASTPAPAPSAPASAKPPTPSAPAHIVPTPSDLRGNTVPMTRLRKVIAERMVESLQVSAQLTSVVEVDVTKIAALRNKSKNAFFEREGVKLSFLPFFAKAACEALKAFPVVNATINQEAGTVTYYDSEHLGIAVDTERGLLVPVISGAGDLNIGGLARKIADLAERTRTNKLSPDELSGGTFTLTNTGSRGALFDTPILNQPQVGILGTGAVVKRPVVVQDENGQDVISIRQMVYLALTYDHRLVDGADAARFLSAIKARLEEGAFEADLGL